MKLIVDIRKDLGTFRLEAAFEAEDGITSLLGPSGCGKSLTLKCIAGIEKPDVGHIELDGHVLFDSEKGIDLPPQKRRVGYLFQRCALARTLAAEPEALLLDEPFSALDEHLKWELELELAQTLEGYGGDAVLVTHSRDEVCRLADAVCVLSGGRSEPVRSAAEMMRAPGTLAAALLSGCKNLSPVRVLPDGSLRCEAWGWRLPAMPVPAGLSHVGIRAHSLGLGPGPLSLDCTLDRIIDNVFSYILTLGTPGGGQLRLECDKQTPLPTTGSPVQVHTDTKEILLLTK